MAKTWIDEVNTGGLFAPADTFFSQLTTMRETFQVTHGDSLKEGKECFKTLVPELQNVGLDVPHHVI